MTQKQREALECEAGFVFTPMDPDEFIARYGKNPRNAYYRVFAAQSLRTGKITPQNRGFHLENPGKKEKNTMTNIQKERIANRKSRKQPAFAKKHLIVIKNQNKKMPKQIRALLES